MGLSQGPAIRQKEISKLVAEVTEFSHVKSKQIVDIILKVVSDSLQRREDVEVMGVGKFYVKWQNARNSRDVWGGVTRWPGHWVVKFKRSPSLELGEPIPFQKRKHNMKGRQIIMDELKKEEERV